MSSAYVYHLKTLVVKEDGSAKTRRYTGYAVDPTRRIKQHRGQLPGGAKSTKINSDWTYAFVVTAGNLTKNKAMSLEAALKAHAKKDKTKCLMDVLFSDKFASLKDVSIYAPYDTLVHFKAQLNARFNGDNPLRLSTWISQSGNDFGDDQDLGVLKWVSPEKPPQDPFVVNAVHKMIGVLVKRGMSESDAASAAIDVLQPMVSE